MYVYLNQDRVKATIRLTELENIGYLYIIVSLLRDFPLVP